MTEQELRNHVVERARSWLGANEGDGSHRKIIDLYNSYAPHPRGYAVQYSDAWCATFVSAVMISLGLDDIAPAECSCPVMIALYRGMGRYTDNKAYVPMPGDIIFYDWEADGTSDHVGIVESAGDKITVIEGNCNNAVARRTLTIGSGSICGYGLPDYARLGEYADAWIVTPPETGGANHSQSAQEAAETPQTNAERHGLSFPVLRNGSTGAGVYALQGLLLLRGYRLPRYGCDGEFGSETLAALKEFQTDFAPETEFSGVCDEKTWRALVDAE